MKGIPVFPVLLFLLYASPLPADYKKGLEAYNNGDYAAAVKWYKIDAELGHARAQFNLGEMYMQGLGVTRNYMVAFKWYKLSAQQGMADAQHNLGAMYEAEYGVTQDYKSALKWYTLAAEQGYVDAQYNLGNMYKNGKGVMQNPTRAHMWWSIAASLGFKLAMVNLYMVEWQMTAAQIEQAQQLARDCVARNFKAC